MATSSPVRSSNRVPRVWASSSRPLSGILQADGALDRPALAAIAFSDEEKRQTLNGIVHPLVATRRSELIAAAGGEDAVIVEDIPLLVESQMAPMFPLVIIVNADPEVRVKRLIEYRGFSEDDARARIAMQATEEQRRLVADVWLDNSGSSGQLVEKARELWYQRILPFAHNLATRTPVSSPTAIVPADPPTWLIRRGESWLASTPPAGTGRCASITSGQRPCPAWTPRTSSTSR